MSLPKRLFASSFPAGASQTKSQSNPIPQAPAIDARLAEQPWASAPPVRVLLNIRLNERRAQRLRDFSIGVVERSSTDQADINRDRTREALAAGMTAADLNRYSRKDAAGQHQLDTGIKDELKPSRARGEDELVPISLDRIWWDLENRLEMMASNIHLTRKEGDNMFSLRITFEPAGSTPSSPSGKFFWDYYAEAPRKFYQDNPQCLALAGGGSLSIDEAVAEDMGDFRDELDSIQRRLYKFGFWYRNPNGTWTINTGQALDPETEKRTPKYYRVRLYPEGKFALEMTDMPAYRQKTVPDPTRQRLRQ